MTRIRAAWQWLTGETGIPRWICILIIASPITGYISH